MKSIYLLFTLTSVFSSPIAPSVITVADGVVQSNNHHDSTNNAINETDNSLNRHIGPKVITQDEIIQQRAEPVIIEELPATQAIAFNDQIVELREVAPRRAATRLVDDRNLILEEDEQNIEFVEELAADFFEGGNDNIEIDNDN